ncbi:hypothetical protein Vi05172_g5558 [Venturia inaequalis]|nr:hypothetical protein Vi05172_g5558 [Venturia inaequalis]
MHLMYCPGPDGKRIYTLKKVIDGEVSKSAHPARFSPDDKYSRHRVTLKKRYGLLLTQQSTYKPKQMIKAKPIEQFEAKSETKPEVVKIEKKVKVEAEPKRSKR